jgi:DnaJ like chaperone protein
MSATTFTEFERLILTSQNQVGTAVLLILSWIAACDGDMDEKERRRLAEISEASKHGSITPLLRIIQGGDLDALQLAAEIIARNFSGDDALLFMEMAVGMAIEDGYLLPSENHVLRFLADLVGLDDDALNFVFEEVTGREIPDPTDPSRAEYWQTREGARRSKSRSSSQSGAQGASDERTRYLAILGLESGATAEEIRKAFRRLAQIHHPDRFVRLGEEAVAAATATFQRIKEAHDYLMKYA